MARRFCKCAPIPLFTVAGDVKEEWAIYRDALEKSGYFNSSVWLDIRGNHDNSNQDSSENHYYREYSTCGKEGPVFNRVIERPFGKYCFVGLDATLTPCGGGISE